MIHLFTKPVAVTALTAMMSLGLTLPAASAMAAEASAHSFQVKSSSGSTIGAGAKAFKKGQFEKSAMFSRTAIKSSLSNKREAIAQSNLCAAYGAMGEMENARLACKAALDLRPDYAPAVANTKVLSFKLAQNK